MRRNDGLKSGLRHRKAEAWVIIEAAWKPQSNEEDIQAVKDWGAKAKARIIELRGEDGPHNLIRMDAASSSSPMNSEPSWKRQRKSTTLTIY